MGVRAEQDDAYLGLWRFRVLPVLGLVLSSGLEHLKKQSRIMTASSACSMRMRNLSLYQLLPIVCWFESEGSVSARPFSFVDRA